MLSSIEAFSKSPRVSASNESISSTSTMNKIIVIETDLPDKESFENIFVDPMMSMHFTIVLYLNDYF
jgi:hypothetical protein